MIERQTQIVINGSVDCKKTDSLGARSLTSQASARLRLCIMTCFSCAGWAFDTQSVLVHFLPNMCLRVASEVTLLEIPPCQTPMCGVAYSCSYVLLVLRIFHKLEENEPSRAGEHLLHGQYSRKDLKSEKQNGKHNGPYSPEGKKWRPRAPGGIMPR